MPEKIEIAVLAQDKFSGVFNDLIGQLGNINPIAGVAASGIVALGAALTKAAMDTVDYADEVRKMMQLTGQSAEEASRVIQVMDDYKVSTSALTMATRTLSKQGLTLNIETLAKLSDEYIKLGSGAEKTKFLIDNFGRSGLQMAEAMQQGSAAIRDASKAVEDGLVMTQKGIDDTRNYQKAVDGLNDNFKGLEITVGTQVVPVLARLVDMTNTYLTAQEKVGWSLFGYKTVLEFVKNRILENNTAHVAAAAAVEGSAGAMDGATLSAEQLAEAEKLAAEAAQAMTAANNGLLSLTMKLQGVNDSYAKSMGDLQATHATLAADLGTLTAQGWPDYSEKVTTATQKLKDNEQAIKDLSEAHDKEMAKIAYDLFVAKLQADGFTDAEFAIAIQAGITAGVIDKKTADMAIKLNNGAKAAQGLADTLMRVPSLQFTEGMNAASEAVRRLAGEYVVNIHTIYTSEGTPGPTGGGVLHHQASGGPGSGGLTLVGERGPELVRVPGGSHVYPNSQSMAMLAGSNNSKPVSVTNDESFVNYGSINVSAQSENDLTTLLRQIRRYQTI